VYVAEGHVAEVRSGNAPVDPPGPHDVTPCQWQVVSVAVVALPSRCYWLLSNHCSTSNFSRTGCHAMRVA